MAAAGSGIFTDADGYEASLRDLLDLLVLCPRDFYARLTWVELPHMQLLRAQESSARVAHLRLRPHHMFVFFATRQDRPLIHGGLELQFGDLICHGQDGRGHQRTTDAVHWGSVAVAGETLSTFGRSIAGEFLVAPAHTQVLRPAGNDCRGLLRLHAQAIRIAETSPNRIVNPEVVRALDQDLLAVLIKCLTTAKVFDHDPENEQQAGLCVQFEQMLGAEPFRLLPIVEICKALGVSQQKFRASCLRLLGMGPGRYQRLRRLKLVRAELTRGGAEQPDVAEIMARYRFTNLDRFVAEYWHVYGEMPPVPARHATGQRI